MKKEQQSKRKALRLQSESVRELKLEKLTEVAGGWVQTGAPSFCNYCVH